ncbi:transposable element Tcb2 transposase [Trichonephila clavipes]|nr:transposable element Tcb2 transposase [Trichonephila clavipes]
MLVSRTDLHIFDAGSVSGTLHCNEILLSYLRLFRGAMGLQFLFMDDNAPCHRTVAAKQLLESEDIERMDWPARSPDLSPIEHNASATCSPPVGAPGWPSSRTVEGLQWMTSFKDWRALMCFFFFLLLGHLQLKDSSG